MTRDRKKRKNRRMKNHNTETITDVLNALCISYWSILDKIRQHTRYTQVVGNRVVSGTSSRRTGGRSSTRELVLESTSW